MASQFCMQCGSPLPPGAAFCSGCGTRVAAPPGAAPAPPVAPGAPPLASAPLPPPSPAPAAGAAGGLSAALGLAGRRNFLVQHVALSMGHSFRVMDPEKNHLFTVQGNAGQNISSNMMGGMLGGSDSYFGRMVARSRAMSYALTNAQGAVLGMILKEGGANHSTFTLTDSSGQRWVTVTLERGMMGGIKATAVDGSGQPLLETSGNLVRHDFVIKDSRGGSEAKVHEAWVAVRDTYNVDLIGTVDPLYPLVFTIMLDFEKVK